MKERPILFSGPMVRAILAGRKTQTRRVVPDQGRCLDMEDEADRERCRLWGQEKYGAPGDQLWVRETRWRNGGFVATDKQNIANEGKVPSIFMRRIDSRITLEVTAVRVERLQQISPEDVLAEGVAKRSRSAAFPWHVYAAEDFAAGWDSINGKRAPWASNPLVWVIGFKRLT